MKQSKVRRKELNAMRQMGNVPWPARRFRYPPTFAAVATNYTCQQLVDVRWKRRGVLRFVRAAKPKFFTCGAQLVAVPFRRALECPSCRGRTRLERREARLRRLGLFERTRRSEPWSVARAARGKFFSRRKV